MKRSKVFYILSFVLIITFLAVGCSKKDMATADNQATTTEEYYDRDDSSTAASDNTAETAASDTAFTEKENGAASVEPTTETNGLSNTSTLNSDGLQAGPQDKIIQNYYLDVETKDFDELITEIDAQIKSLGGYVESSQISGTSFYNSKNARTGNIVARIPSAKASEFVGKINEKANIVNNQKTTDNVSLKYIDAQSRIETLKIEQERLFAILEKTEDLKSIITLESRLSDIRYELQNYESQLRTYDNQVEYSTVSLNITEVERITPVTEVKQTFSSRIKNGFSDTIYNISEGFKDFFVWFIVNLPYLLIWGVIIAIVLLIVRRFIKKENAKKNLSSSEANYGQFNQGHYQNQQYQGQMSQEQQNQGQRNQPDNKNEQEKQ